MNHINTTKRDAMKLKKIMIETKTYSIFEKCPECDGEMSASLAENKDHMRFRCDGPCKRKFME